VQQRALLVRDRVAGPAGAVALRVAALCDEVRDYAVASEAVVEVLLRQENEVVDRERRRLGVQLNDDVAFVGLDRGDVALVHVDGERRRLGEAPA
jgi:hypothetical protein